MSGLLLRMNVRAVAILSLFILLQKEAKSEETIETIEETTVGNVEVNEEPQSCGDIVEEYMHLVMKNRLENVRTRVFVF